MLMPKVQFWMSNVHKSGLQKQFTYIEFNLVSRLILTRYYQKKPQLVNVTHINLVSI